MEREMAEKDNVPPTYIVKDKYLKKLSKIEMKGEFSKKEIMKIIGNSRITENFISEFSWSFFGYYIFVYQ